MTKKEIWNLGEKIATKFLFEKWMKFVEKNFHTKYWEIDLIFKEKNELIFVEVKTRNSIRFWEWFESINKKKIDKMIKTWQIYCFQKKLNFDTCRFDVISILLDKDFKRCKIKHFVKII